ncbi:YciK family oxidoreductase [Sulfurimicrobium lacus]|uniref:YciK family oxidoreductase n=1 Tax=Sulfurimicrobium lacus TaxID=2715678 RepID=A0A6F8VDW5_9PROT|nr:YciK family oxidoreductase [Sulfurimicrobium lacus]BCB26955.1 YciK family oxidoreductase [Sulfurimicrobium lacus]
MKNYQAPKNLLQDRVVLVTGAGQGIGRTAALAFAAHGATVILHGRNVAKLEAVYDEIEAAGGPQAAIFPLDLYSAEEKDYESFAGGIRGQLGRLDGILHNAAHLDTLHTLESHSLEQWQASIKVNLLAPFALTRACLPLLKAAPDASVVMTSETHGHTPAAFWGSFAVSMAGVETMVKMWAQELELYPNLRLNAIVPGAVQSPQRTKTHPGEVKESLPEPESLMPQYLYLMGGDSRGVSGQIVVC